jgi:hypothetical protein
VDAAATLKRRRAVTGQQTNTFNRVMRFQASAIKDRAAFLSVVSNIRGQQPQIGTNWF